MPKKYHGKNHAKNYKLTKGTNDDGTPRTCAFFFSEKGCNNASACKFSHDKPGPEVAAFLGGAARAAVAAPAVAAPAVAAPAPSVSSSAPSSESESDGEIVETRAGAYASLAIGQVDVRSSIGAVAVPEPIAPAAAAPTPPPAEKMTKKRESTGSTLAEGESPFYLHGAKPSTPAKKEETVFAACPPSPPAAAVDAPPKKKSKKAPIPTPDKSPMPHPPTTNSPKPHPPTTNSPKPHPPTTKSPKPHPPTTNTAPPSFRNLQLPIAAFTMPPVKGESAPTPEPDSPVRPSTPEPEVVAAPLPLPIATPAHLAWKEAVIATRVHANYPVEFNFNKVQQVEFNKSISTPDDWVETRPYGEWCASNPASIAIDCEMCGTKDPITGNTDAKALCRVSIVNGENPEEVLLDTLVKPNWPVTDYRTFINGITKKDLDGVEFTLAHAQQFMQALCSDQTVIVGHAVDNDLMSMRLIHHCNADTAMLYTSVNNDGTPSLKNLAHSALAGREMPEVHDSVNDARVALMCARHWADNKGNVEPVEKVFRRPPRRNFKDHAETPVLMIHRLPKGTRPEHISEMFEAHTNMKPKEVKDITFGDTHGKGYIEFNSMEHAELAYVSLKGPENQDKTGRKQKRVSLKGGGYVCVRKMEGGTQPQKKPYTGGYKGKRKSFNR